MFDTVLQKTDPETLHSLQQNIDPKTLVTLFNNSRYFYEFRNEIDPEILAQDMLGK
jgi:hypothetical protein